MPSLRDMSKKKSPEFDAAVDDWKTARKIAKEEWVKANIVSIPTVADMYSSDADSPTVIRTSCIETVRDHGKNRYVIHNNGGFATALPLDELLELIGWK